ncbi:uncharacterized protein BXZ73DRAFT_74988 [Epithele typhae]|uniref:uncharacterized protein n=1 Tax=Epithele typhae TaxID=378194 RepID=UPI002007723A|nr:uncharacterized protein BXZ73DRAFT_74988 [Epithele typhae]KAH9941807.1 hypothetical protein BXZ73DRAFT_74988 [Epithele typhae]
MASLFVLIALAQTVQVATQGSNATCKPEFQWMDNSLGQNPCVLSSWLQVPCTGSAVCQGLSAATYPFDIPIGTALPAWAYLPVASSKEWDVAAGEALTADEYYHLRRHTFHPIWYFYKHDFNHVSHPYTLWRSVVVDHYKHKKERREQLPTAYTHTPTSKYEQDPKGADPAFDRSLSENVHGGVDEYSDEVVHSLSFSSPSDVPFSPSSSLKPLRAQHGYSHKPEIQ